MSKLSATGIYPWRYGSSTFVDMTAIFHYQIHGLQVGYYYVSSVAMNNRLDSSCISFCTSSGKGQLKTSQVDTKLCQLQLSK